MKQETRDNNHKQNYIVESSPGTARSSGVAILYKPHFIVKNVQRDTNGCFLLITFSHEEVESSFQVLAIYGPNEKRLGDDFFASLLPIVNPSLPLILCGNFNVVADPHVDRYGCNPDSPWAYNWPSSLTTLVETFDLLDIWRHNHPNERSYTWRRANGAQASRLDMFWLSSTFVEHVPQVDIFPFFRSDHSYVFLKISFPSIPTRGPGI